MRFIILPTLLFITSFLLGYAVATEIYTNQAEANYKRDYTQHHFRTIPTDKLHTMRVYEDGSYNIEYQDNTSEVGCLPTGLCQD